MYIIHLDLETLKKTLFSSGVMSQSQEDNLLVLSELSEDSGLDGSLYCLRYKYITQHWYYSICFSNKVIQPYSSFF
jgi:hypothetical protein